MTRSSALACAPGLRALACVGALWLGATGEVWGQPSTSAVPAQAVAKPEAEADSDIQAAVEQFRQGNLGGSLEALQKARDANPALPPARLMLARLLLNVDEIPIARGLLEDVAAEDPGYPATYALFGNIALSEGRLSDAQLNFEKALAVAPDAASLTEDEREETLSQAISGLAAVAERRQDWEAARAALEELVGRRPEDGPARQRLGRSLFFLDRADEALARFEEAVQRNPTLDPPRITLGWLLADRGRFDEALAAMREAVDQGPEDPATHLGLGTYLLQREQPREALPEVEFALEQAPDSLPAKQLLGAIAHRLNDHERAEELLSSVLEVAPEDPSTSNLLALALAEQPDEAKRQRAVELAQANLRRVGQDPQTLSTLGWTLYRAGKLEEATQLLQAAASSGQASPDTAYYLACVLADKGQTADAEQLLRSALEAPIGQFTARDEARERLEAIDASRLREESK